MLDCRDIVYLIFGADSGTNTLGGGRGEKESGNPPHASAAQIQKLISEEPLLSN